MLARGHTNLFATFANWKGNSVEPGFDVEAACTAAVVMTAIFLALAALICFLCLTDSGAILLTWLGE